MSETIIPTATMRRGQLVERFGVPENLPSDLENFTWPKEYAKRLAEAAKVADALYEAHEAWTAAHEEFEDVAPAADQSALEAAIRAGEPDPGTPATDAADRAEHVAWTRLQLALDDARNATYKDVLRDYLREQVEHLAAHELTREQAHAEATRKAAELMAEVEQGSNKPGHASATMKQYVAERWSEDDDTDTLLVARDGDSDSRRRAITERNAAILARWRREVNSEPEPAYDITTAKATELGAAVAYGSPTAAAELRRRKATPATA
jgi:hypothetical protein